MKESRLSRKVLTVFSSKRKDLALGEQFIASLVRPLHNKQSHSLHFRSFFGGDKFSVSIARAPGGIVKYDNVQGVQMLGAHLRSRSPFTVFLHSYEKNLFDYTRVRLPDEFSEEIRGWSHCAGEVEALEIGVLARIYAYSSTSKRMMETHDMQFARGWTVLDPGVLHVGQD